MAILVMPHAQLVFVKFDKVTIPYPVFDMLDGSVTVWHLRVDAYYPDPVPFFENVLHFTQFVYPSASSEVPRNLPLVFLQAADVGQSREKLTH